MKPAGRSIGSRKIIHCDCDCFYAAVEMRDDPSLRGRPLAVGGSPERRGVVATCNYEARAFGISSAMPTAHALRLCPQLIVVPPDMPRYREVAAHIREIFNDYTERVEPLSLDEAYLDVTDSQVLHGSGTLIAEDIRRRVRETVGITISAGVAPNKFLAKIASDWRKPDGLFVIRPEEAEAFLSDLPVDRLHGVGAVTARRLHALDIHTCADLRAAQPLMLVQRFGRFGKRLAELARGIDDRPVAVRRRKSISVEETFARDLPDVEACLQELPQLEQRLRRRIGDSSVPIQKQFVKLKFNNFRQTTVETLSGSVQSSLFSELVIEAFARGARPVRLLGVGVRLGETAAPQLSLFASATDS
ncbi:MAG: DNA polymerase IV [Spongiibacteraceae bacterium]|jgi:DNA polymerase-4|nr:DNA polymerase IV [Spongiibacteraceae bacterium]